MALTAEQLRDLLARIAASDYCRDHDMVYPITLLIATGLRRSELLALRWVDLEEGAATLAVTEKLIRVPGAGLRRFDTDKTASARRAVPLPAFAITALTRRWSRPFLGRQPMIFPSSSGTWRDPDNFGKQWRKVGAELKVPDVTMHSFRKTVADLIDRAGLSARVGADQLGHATVSMTQDRYMSRGRVHRQVAYLLDDAVLKR